MQRNKWILFEEKEDCCGCGACMNICPKKAIHMVEDKDGYLYPEIDQYLCVQCGKCKSVCVYQNGMQRSAPIQVKAAMNLNTDQLNKSSSGGIFSVLAESVLEKKGVVYGAGYSRKDSELIVKHLRIDSFDTLKLIQGSKYTQSVIDDAYSLVKRDLISGSKVLFSGTPCQVAGLKGFLGREYENLYTVDVICHGVPNQRQFSSFIKYFEKKYGGKVEALSFRDKAHGWSDYYIRADIRKKNGSLKTKYIYCKTSAYYWYFLNSDIFRKNCYSCPYANKLRVGDITLGDFWGIEKVHSELFNKENWKNGLYSGISCVLVNTAKGEELYQMCQEKISSETSFFERAAQENGQLKHPSIISEQRKQILNIWREYGYEKVQKDFRSKMGWRYYYIYIRKKIAPYIKNIFRSKKV